MAIDNQIFNHYREQQAKIEESIKLLEEHGYIVQKQEDKTTYPNQVHQARDTKIKKQACRQPKSGYTNAKGD